MGTALVAPAGPSVGIGQIAVSDDPGAVISALGLGSCIGVVLIDRAARLAGMAHVMLPASPPGSSGPPGKYADTAVPALIDSLVALGADRVRLGAWLAGGAQMFGGGSGATMLNIGGRNDLAVRAALREAGIRVRAADVGGNCGRTMQVRVGAGSVSVRLVGGEAIDL